MEHDDEVQLCGLRDPFVKDVPSLGPHQPGKVPGHDQLIVVLKEDAVENKIASADNFTVTGPCFRQAEAFFQVSVSE